MKKDNPAVIAHVDMMQGIINRLAGNSKSCKQWCILVVSAILTLTARDADVFLLRLTPVIMFCFLDCFYLNLERQAINSLNAFIDKLANYDDVDDLVYRVVIGRREKAGEVQHCLVISIVCKIWKYAVGIGSAFLSLSILPFYLGLTLLLYFLN